ncbi:uncharacterized protein LOC123541039 [Mercenaria mercenaria]|uniref:uncharacterized protein LOC123541039 n=1 Tax=Mercenaria mercenaria TaxID=6596 RepID=UPI00234EEDE7|nr:uncharacterized protein LOC123541039 [Mercenaria mercenaria]
MVVVTTTGYFVTIVGPFFADSKNNDAAILNHMLRSNTEDIRNFVKEKDIIVVDRGFRDSVSLLEDLGLRAEMPAFMTKGAKQMPTDDANSSRMVTKIRWVVESANARIKAWKYLDHVLPTSQVPYIGDYVRIVCAVCNKYLPPLSLANLEESDIQLAAHMRHLSSQVNMLKTYVEENKLERGNAEWSAVNDEDLDCFPKLTEEQLRTFTCGVYQLRLSPSYIQEYIDGDSDIYVHKENANLIRVRIQSRHVSSRTYLLWLQFTASEVTAWYCKCRAGARVVGVCAHVAAIVWYLSYARYFINRYGVCDWGLHLSDASNLPDPIDSSETESEASCIEE